MNRFVVLAAAAALAACADPHEPLSPDFGNAVRANAAAQIVNPNPPPATTTTDGARLNTAIHRYETNTVIQPQSQTGLALSPGTTPMAPPPALTNP